MALDNLARAVRQRYEMRIVLPQRRARCPHIDLSPSARFNSRTAAVSITMSPGDFPSFPN
jgi:hypothetical protein